MNGGKRSIHVKGQFEGFHSWPEAPDEVAFLRTEHRHMFHIDLWIEVKDDDRELEFILVERWLRGACRVFYQEMHFGAGVTYSCENIAQQICTGVGGKYGLDRSIKVEVSEDGENGGIYKWTA